MRTSLLLLCPAFLFAMACSASSGLPEGANPPEGGAGGKAAGGKTASGGTASKGGSGGGAAGQSDAGAPGNAGAAGSAGAPAPVGGAGGKAGGGIVVGGAAGQSAAGAPGEAGAAGEPGAAGESGAGGAPAPPEVSLVYAHSPDTLYKLDPVSKEVTLVGDFDCLKGFFDAPLDEMFDLAIDAGGYMVGSSSSKLYVIDPTNAKCKTLATGSFPNSLTFVPKGVLDPNVEVLVGYVGSTYYRIDPSNGKRSEVGSLNPNATGQSWESSGDIVSISGAKTYLTAHAPGGSEGNDTLLEVDPKTGKAIAIVGNVGYPKLWGLAYWASVAYGFSENGSLVQIDLATGAGKSVPIPNKPSGLSFYGAGVTTNARIEPIVK